MGNLCGLKNLDKKTTIENILAPCGSADTEKTLSKKRVA